MLCNVCWETLGEQAVCMTPCQHVCCRACATTKLTAVLACPVCSRILQKDGVREMQCSPSPGLIKERARACFGFEPEELASVFMAGLQFWTKQKEYEVKSRSVKISQQDSQLESKAEEIKSLKQALAQEQLKCKDAGAELQNVLVTLRELEGAYHEKSAKARKLQQELAALRDRQAALPPQRQNCKEVEHHGRAGGPRCRSPSRLSADPVTTLPYRPWTAGYSPRKTRKGTLEFRRPFRAVGADVFGCLNSNFLLRVHRVSPFQSPRCY